MKPYCKPPILFFYLASAHMDTEAGHLNDKNDYQNTDPTFKALCYLKQRFIVFHDWIIGWFRFDVVVNIKHGGKKRAFTHLR